jgi:ABC-type sugar transport system substrate-binding protein
LDAFKEAVPDAEVVSDVDSKGQRETGANVTADALTANPDINVIFGVNDDCALGGVASVEARGLSDKISVFGLGGISDEPLNAVMDAKSPFIATVSFAPFEYGRASMNDYVIPLLNGEKPPMRINAPIALATADNAKDFMTGN